MQKSFFQRWKGQGGGVYGGDDTMACCLNKRTHTPVHSSSTGVPYRRDIETGQQPQDPLFLFTAAAHYRSNENRVVNTVDDYLQ
eukprot:6460287-Pyramimonas_sp.AAC.1